MWMNLANMDQDDSSLGLEDIQVVRRQLVNRGLVYYAALTPIAVAISLLRILEHG